MGAGRKTSTYEADTKANTKASVEEAKRNLGEVGKLGAVIFGEHAPAERRGHAQRDVLSFSPGMPKVYY